MNLFINHIQYFIFALVLSMISALQPGLVNLTVAKTSSIGNKLEAKLIARGASFIEVIYGIIAISYGTIINDLMLERNEIKLAVIVLLLIVGVFYLARKNVKSRLKESSHNGFLKGIVLNLISLQVFLFWILAITVSAAFIEFENYPTALLVYGMGIWLGKNSILYLYQIIGERIFKNIKIINRNSNKIIGLLLIGSAVIQIFKI